MSNSAPAEKRKRKPFYKVKLWSEFKAFINRGNIIDLAVAVILGAAFSAIVTSLVNDLLMPFIAAATGKSLNDISLVVSRGNNSTNEEAIAAAIAGGKESEGVIVIFYGKFIQAVINFFIIAVVMFFVVKAYMAMKNGTKNRYFGFSREEYKAFKAKGLRRSEIRAQAVARAAELEAKAKADAELKAKNSVEGILKDIRALLEKQTEQNAAKSA